MPALSWGEKTSLRPLKARTAGVGTDHLAVIELAYQAEQHIHSIAELDAEAEAYLDSEVGPHPASYSTGTLDEEHLSRLLSKPISDVIGEITERRGGSRAVREPHLLRRPTIGGDRTRVAAASGPDRGVQGGSGGFSRTVSRQPLRPTC